MKARVTFLAVLLTVFVVVSSPAWAQSICDNTPGNLVVNCGFETGDFSGWSQGGNTGFTGVTTGIQNSGNYAAYMGPVGSDGFLIQDVGGNGTQYNVSFYLYNEGGTPNDFTVYWNGTDVGPDLVDAGAFGYTLFFGTLSGNMGAFSNQLAFGFRHDPAFWFLDDVVVTTAGSSTPEPGSLILFGSGILGLAGVIRRKLGA